jgi:hypothetical protein
LDIVQDLLATNPDELKVINRGSGVTVRWTGGDSSTVATISGGSATVSPSGTTISGAAFACIQNTSAGSFTVPASILMQIPASAVSSLGGFNFVTRGSFGISAAGQGARLPTPSGLDILTANNGWTWAFTPQYQ